MPNSIKGVSPFIYLHFTSSSYTHFHTTLVSGLSLALYFVSIYLNGFYPICEHESPYLVLLEVSKYCLIMLKTNGH